MTWNQIIESIERDLNVGDKVSRRYMLLFRNKYKGQKEAIQGMKVSFSDTGKLVFLMTINNKQTKLEV